MLSCRLVSHTFMLFTESFKKSFASKSLCSSIQRDLALISLTFFCYSLNTFVFFYFALKLNLMYPSISSLVAKVSSLSDDVLCQSKSIRFDILFCISGRTTSNCLLTLEQFFHFFFSQNVFHLSCCWELYFLR